MDVVINAQLREVREDNAAVIPPGNFYHIILSCLGYPNEAPPVADLLRRYHGLEGKWLIASPIHWQATHNDAMIIASGDALDLTEEESYQLFEDFKAFVAADNIALHYHDAHTWLIQCVDKPPINAKPPHTILHHSLMSELKMLDDTHFWQSFITENQMFFSSHPLNKERCSYPINGLWFWGEGELGAPTDRPFIYAEESLRRLATLLSTNVSMYEPSIKYVKNNMLLFEGLQQNELAILQTQLQKNTVHWHWNNIAYYSKRKRWWTRG